MGKLKDIFSKWQVLLLIVILIAAVWTIQPRISTKGVLIAGIEPNSSAEINGLKPGEIIYSVNGREVQNLEDYSKILSSLSDREITSIKTNKGEYSLVAEEKNGTIYLGITPKEVPSSNLKRGLDLIGGARVLLKPNQNITDQQLSDAIMMIEKRLNVYGLSDIVVKSIKDLEGNKYILVEMAGATKEEVTSLVSQQGKFEAKIGNETVFVGGKDIKAVCRSADCSGIELNSCGQIEEGTWGCRFRFAVDISPEAAEKHAAITRNLEVISVDGQRYLSKKLDLYLDDELVDSLYISENLKGKKETRFVIQGSGLGSSEKAAINNALENMKRLQTLLITGSLPVKLDVVKVDIVSPTLGEHFFKSALIALGAALIGVGAVIFMRYRRFSVALPIMLTMISEVIIILGFAALIKWNLDLAAIAGILAAVGTGVDHQIVITDEVLGKHAIVHDWKKRIKNAFFIIFGAYFTTLVAMTPLLTAGAGLLKGFALTTIAGISIGVFITRPAFSKIIEVLLK